MVHRDLKPSNVILTPDIPVVIDFGVAAAGAVTTLTSTGTALGSPGWMAPEQVRGEHVTAAADVFIWGALMAFAAAGTAPFGTGRPEAVAYRVAHEAPDVAGISGPLAPLARRYDNDSLNQLSFVTAESVDAVGGPFGVPAYASGRIWGISGSGKPIRWDSAGGGDTAVEEWSGLYGSAGLASTGDKPNVLADSSIAWHDIETHSPVLNE